MALIYQCGIQHQSPVTMLSQTETYVKLSSENNNNGRFSSISRKKKIVAGVGVIVFFLILIIVFLCVFSSRKENSANFQKQCDLAIAAMNSTMHIYCSYLPEPFAENCDQFASGFLATIDPPLPQVTLQQQENIHDPKTRTGFFVNMTTTVEKYIILIDQIMKEEHDLLCHSFIVAGMKCRLSEFCTEKTSHTAFYCRLHLVHNYLTQLKKSLEKEISDLSTPVTSLDDAPDFWRESLSVFRHWYTMAVFKDAVRQVETFRNALESSRI